MQFLWKLYVSTTNRCVVSQSKFSKSYWKKKAPSLNFCYLALDSNSLCIYITQISVLLSYPIFSNRGFNSIKDVKQR